MATKSMAVQTEESQGQAILDIADLEGHLHVDEFLAPEPSIEVMKSAAEKLEKILAKIDQMQLTKPEAPAQMMLSEVLPELIQIR